VESSDLRIAGAGVVAGIEATRPLQRITLLQGGRRSSNAGIPTASRGDVSGISRQEFEKLALPLLDSLYNFARWISGDPDEAHDLVQETFAKALKATNSFREGTNFRAWMFRILRNTFLTSRTGLERRHTEQESEKGFEDSVVTQETPELALIRRADTELVQQGIASLQHGFQEVLILADLEEMKYQEIAAVLDIPIGTVMSRLARARKQLRQFLVDALQARPGDRKLVAKS
jgi:RNA polymerase sigma-70 factor, ECF subfamily